jgi:hypothetical protein
MPLPFKEYCLRVDCELGQERTAKKSDILPLISGVQDVTCNRKST